MSKISFNSTNKPFASTLRTRVHDYFKTHGLSSTGNRKLYIKSILLVSIAVALYLALLFLTMPIWVSCVLCVLLGVTFATVGFNIMHEGGHQSFSKKAWLNNVSAYTLNMLGGTIYFWKQKHNISHHTYTNVDGLDHDIDIKFMRMHADQPRRWFHRFQFAYWFVLYGISYIAWVLFQDFEKYFSGKMGIKADRKSMPLREHLIFWGTKLCYAGVYLVIPIFMVGWSALLGWLIVGVSCGFCLAVVFQLAHVVESTQFPVADGDSGKIEQEWMVHQLSTTANFATGSRIVSWLLGGLNFQVEHHLFPRISHVHYPAINKLVKATCEEFGVVYLEHRTMGHAFASHLRHIYRLGRS
ncbi:acyl-CoA desaturase [Parapedobacter sp. ISTM3]|uniref:Linoleoyl-CoA desaturase n=1 Tax=Parapedobacter luteus TaxID=623280 RepID=A0A1T5A0M1_9SPHI|nr:MULTISPECIES: acyl-CoA desaturase [Parapedobacter]MBK1442536.1 acyl-CoA desaturase [Parapedobacter sp. ISTM3]SKB28571.1 linoleoyl-CoA desaturase [Parapedobacter luteus]